MKTKFILKNRLLKKLLILSLIGLIPSSSAFADSNYFDPSSWATLIMQNLDYTADIMQCIQIFMGIALLAGGLHGFHKFGQSRTSMSQHVSLVGPMIKFIAGTALLTSFTWINTLLFATFGNASPEANPFSTTSNSLEVLYEPTLMLVRLLGVGVFMKMIVTFARAGSQHAQPGSVGKGFIYGVSSIMCIHIQTTLQLITSFFGFASPF